MSLSTPRDSAQILLLTAIVLTATGAQALTFTLDKTTTFSISGTRARGCTVCTGTEPTRQCGSSLLIRNATSVSLSFRCPRPQDVFTVELERNIECGTELCDGHITHTDSRFSPLQDFNRTFTWNLTASGAFQIDFSRSGLRQIHPSEICPDGHSYTLQASQTTGDVTVGKYCRGGLITSAQVLNRGSFSLDVPAGRRLQSGQFDLSAGEEIQSFAKITLTFPEETSSLELLSPNYPDTFPDNDIMEWYIRVPENRKTSVRVLHHTQPRCLNTITAVEHHSKGRAALVQSLTALQPVEMRGNVSLTLRICEMDRRRIRRSSSSGLSVNIRVSTRSTALPVLCKVDMSDAEGLSLYIEKSRSATECKMKINSVIMDKITVTSNSELSFQDCLPGDVQVTAMRVIECRQLKDCPKTPVPLLLPVMPSCLPVPLTSATWTFRPPQRGTVELASPDGPLKQSLPGQPCNDSVLIKLTEGNGSTIGDFCTQGAIEKVQIHTNMSVTVSSTEGKAVRMSYKHVLNASFKGEIPERYIFTVATKKDIPVFLATPGWPVGMKGYSTVSWVVSVPPNMEARLTFANLSQPKCSNQHTDISVQRVGRPALDYSRREDEEAESELTVSGSFYLNMSNCRVERGRFSVISKITLQVPGRKTLLTISLSVAAALVVVFVIALVVACVVIKKKKKPNHQTSIYNPNGTNVLQGPKGFTKMRTDNESPVYATIDETLIYTHLLEDDAQFSVYREFGTNQPAPDSEEPRVSYGSGADNMEVGLYRPFQAPPLPDRPQSKLLVDNEIYQARNEGEEGHSVILGPRLEPEGGN